MQSSEEVYDHLADVHTGPERLATFSRSHSWVGEKNSPSTSLVLTVWVGRGETVIHRTTAGQGLPWFPRLPPTRSWALWAAERVELSRDLGLGGREGRTQGIGLGSRLGGKPGEESESESERSQSATAGTRVLARPSRGRLFSSQNAAGQGM